MPNLNTLWIVCILAAASTATEAEDWPTYRHDVARSGISREKIQPPFSESWVFKSPHAPRPAWGNPNPNPIGKHKFVELRRMHFDDVFQVVAAGGSVYFGSSADNKVYCLDAATGRIRWTKITGGPIRLAPTIADGRLFVGSDDGYVYCLRADDGSEVWKFRAAPEDRRVLGHGKMISLWPVRSGVLVDDGVAYFGAGVFPAEGVFMFAVSAKDGREIWRNDACGEKPQSRISPQGYLLASETAIYAPMARLSPAAFDRQTGRFLHETYFGQSVGGTYALMAGQTIYTGTKEIVAYNRKTRDKIASFAGRKMVVTDDTAYLAGNGQLAALDRAPKSDRWKIDCPHDHSLILAGDVLFAGGVDRVIAVEATSGNSLWSATVEGAAKGLAVADGRLLVSTDKGLIYCFGSEGTPQHGPVIVLTGEDPYAGSPLGPIFKQAAETILNETQVKRGYCLVLGCRSGHLALELARRSELMIYVVEPDAHNVAAARKMLDAAGVYGSRVCVEKWPLEKVPYADYFANLIVSESAILTGELPSKPAEMFRMLKPLGGTALLGQPSEPAGDAKRLDEQTIRRWLGQSKLEAAEVLTSHGAWAKIVRGPLPGAGSWTHQYANPGNTACGDDRLLKCPLGVLWFGNPGPEKAPERHLRAAAPLSIDGRLFVQGEGVIAAYDAYNGLKLWSRDIQGIPRFYASHNTSNMALDHEGLFLAAGNRCVRLDPVTGHTMTTYELPRDDDKPHAWGYVARAGELLYGSRVARAPASGLANSQPGKTFFDLEWDDALSQADCLFAMDVQSGELRWIHRGKPLPQNSISIGDDTVFFVSPEVTPEQRKTAIDQRRRSIAALPEAERAKAEKMKTGVHVGRVVALDSQTGKVRWEKPLDLTGCGGEGHARINWSGQEAKLATIYNNGVLVIFGVYLDGHHWAEFFAGKFASRRITALRGADGEVLWSRPIGFRVRPLVIGDTLHAEPWKLDLHTGEPKMRPHPMTGRPGRWQFARPGHHCGCPAASVNCLFFRSFTFGYYDLVGDFGTIHFGGQRPGCWINAIPAAGLLLVPEASAGCTCSFPNACTLAFAPTATNKAWGMFSAPGPTTPVKRLALNLGMSGDRNDAAGNLWLGYPRPFGNPPPGYPQPGGALVLRFDVDTAFYPGGGFHRRNSTYTDVSGTDNPWLFTSSARGLRKLVIPLLGRDDPASSYRVRLAFAAVPGDKPGQRVFDVKLQNKLVEESFDVARAAGGAGRALFKEFPAVEVRDNLTLEFVAKVSEPSEHQWPILQAIECVAESK